MRKPNIKKPGLKWVKDRKGVWQPYFRVTWSENGKRRERATLLRWEGNPQTLDTEYWKCRTGKHPKQQPSQKYTWGEIITIWKADPRVKVAAGTRRKYIEAMEEIGLKNGGMDMRTTTRQMMRKAHEARSATPRQADRYIETSRMLWNYAANKKDWPLGKNPAAKFDMFGKQRELEAWPDWMVGKLDNAPENVRCAANLILGTGQRPNAAITMKHEDFDGDSMWVLDEKNAERIKVFCPSDLRDYVSSLPIDGAHILAKNLREPLGYDRVEKQFRAWRSGLVESAQKYSMHGLRKLAIIRLAEAGCTDAEIQAVTNQSAEMVAYYRQKANRRRLSENAQRRRDS